VYGAGSSIVSRSRAALNPSRVTAAGPAAVGPLRLAVAATPLEHKHLILLQHVPDLLEWLTIKDSRADGFASRARDATGRRGSHCYKNAAINMADATRNQPGSVGRRISVTARQRRRVDAPDVPERDTNGRATPGADL
jgi:hypothetical protein